jgi:hypothetical protein
MAAKDYTAFLKSIHMLFNSVVKEKNWRLAIQIKSLEAKCRGFVNNTKPELKSLDLKCTDELENLLSLVQSEIKED